MENVVGRGTLLAGRYRTLQPIASDLPGSSIWEATDQILDRPVRVTVLHAGHVPQALDAARRAALVTDPRLARVLDVGEHEGVAYTVTEQVNGPSLAELVARGPLPADQARAIVGEAAAALEVARRRGVHHLTLRPSVLHLTPDDRVLLTGLAVDGALLGRDTHDAEAATRADTVGLVGLLYAALTGRSPRIVPGTANGPLPHLAAAPILEGAPVPPAELASGVPNDLDTLCAVTLGVHDDGPRTPAELVQELEPWGDIRATDLFAGTQVLPTLPPASPTAPVPAPDVPATPVRVQRTSVRTVFAGSPATPRPGTPPPAVPSRSSAFTGPVVGAAPVGASPAGPAATPPPAARPVPDDAPTAAMPAAAPPVSNPRASAPPSSAPTRPTTPVRPRPAAAPSAASTAAVDATTAAPSPDPAHAGPPRSPSDAAPPRSPSDAGPPRSPSDAAPTAVQAAAPHPATPRPAGRDAPPSGRTPAAPPRPPSDAAPAVGQGAAGPAVPTPGRPPARPSRSPSDVVQPAAPRAAGAAAATSGPTTHPAADSAPTTRLPVTRPDAPRPTSVPAQSRGGAPGGTAAAASAGAPPAQARATTPPAPSAAPTRPAPTRPAPTSAPQRSPEQPGTPWSAPPSSPASPAGATPFPVTAASSTAPLAPSDEADRLAEPDTADRSPLLSLGSRPGGIDVAAARETIAAHRFDPTRFVLLLVGLAIVLGLFTAYRALTRPVDLSAGSPDPVATQSASAEPAAEEPAAEPAPEPEPEAPAGPPVIASAAQLDPPPEGDENEHPEAVQLAIDGDPTTAWFTRTYNGPDFAGLKTGVGYAVTLAEPATVSTVTLQVLGSGGRVEVRATDPATPTQGDVLAEGALGPETVLALREPTETQHVVLWFTELPQTADGANRLELAEVTLS